MTSSLASLFRPGSYIHILLPLYFLKYIQGKCTCCNAVLYNQPRTCCSRLRMTATAWCRISNFVWGLSLFRCSWTILPSSLNASLMSRTRRRSRALLAILRSLSLSIFCSGVRSSSSLLLQRPTMKTRTRNGRRSRGWRWEKRRARRRIWRWRWCLHTCLVLIQTYSAAGLQKQGYNNSRVWEQTPCWAAFWQFQGLLCFLFTLSHILCLMWGHIKKQFEDNSWNKED